MDESGYFYERTTLGFTLQIYAPGATSPDDLKRLGDDALVNLKSHDARVLFPFIDVGNYLDYCEGESHTYGAKPAGKIREQRRRALHRTLARLVDAPDDAAAEAAIRRLFPIRYGILVNASDLNLVALGSLMSLHPHPHPQVPSEEDFDGVLSIAAKMQGMTREAAYRVSRQTIDTALANFADVFGPQSEKYLGIEQRLRRNLVPEGDSYRYDLANAPMARSHLYRHFIKTVSLALRKARDWDQQARLIASMEALSHVGVTPHLEAAGHTLFCCRPPRGRHGDPHPIVAGAMALMLGEQTAYLSRDDVYASPLFSSSEDNDVGFRRIKGGEHINGLPTFTLGRGSYAGLISRIAKAPNPEAKRNAFQFLRRMDWCPSLATNESSLMAQNADVLWEGVYAGRKLKHVVFDALKPDHADARRVQGGFGKHELRCVLNNAKALDNLLHWRQSGTLQTFDGDRLALTIHDQAEDEAVMSDTFSGTMTVHDRNGTLRFTRRWKQAAFHSTLRGLDVRNVLSLTQLPIAKADSFQAFHAMIRPLSRYSNPLLAEHNVAGFYLNKDKQITRKAYSGWIDRLLREKDDPRAMHRFTSRSSLVDGEAISQSLLSTLLLHHVERAGIAVESTYASISDFLDTHDPGEAIGAIINRRQYALDALSIPLSDSRHPVSINYLKLLDIAERLHHSIGVFRKRHAPRVGIAWEPCLAAQPIGRVGGRGLTVHPLHTYQAIVEEGARQDHCLATYASRCAAGTYYAFAVELDGAPLATLGMTYDNEGLALDQLQGYRNSPVPGTDKACIEAFAEALVSETREAAHQAAVASFTLAPPGAARESASAAGTATGSPRYGFRPTRYATETHDHALTPQALLSVELGLDYQSEACADSVCQFLCHVMPARQIEDILLGMVDRLDEPRCAPRWDVVRQRIVNQLNAQDAVMPRRSR